MKTIVVGDTEIEYQIERLDWDISHISSVFKKLCLSSTK